MTEVIGGARRGRIFVAGGVLAVLALFGTLAARPIAVDAAPVQDFVLESFSSGFSVPTDMAWAPNGLLFVAEKAGVIKVIDDGTVSTFIDISDEVNDSDERGLLGIAIHPSFTTGQPWVYALYSHDPPQAAQNTGAEGQDGAGQRVSLLSRYRASAATGFTTVVNGSDEIILGGSGDWTEVGDPAAVGSDLSPDWACGVAGNFTEDCLASDAAHHTIGTVAFGPDGMLYVGNGDGAAFSGIDPRNFRSQDLDSLSGKIMRIDPDNGRGLSDNPHFDGDDRSNRSRIYYRGLRNPFRFTVDPATGDVWVGDVGSSAWEELDQGAPGSDFGWPCYEGGASGTLELAVDSAVVEECETYYQSNNAVAPRFSYDRKVGKTIVVGEFYTGAAWPTEYHGSLVVADFISQWIKAIRTDTTPVTEVPLATDVMSVSLRFGPDGHLYTVNIATGSIDRIRYVPAVDPPGSLRVDTSPPIPSMISVDGLNRSEWGLDWLRLPAGGPYDVCFGDVPLRSTPPCQSVFVTPGGTTTVVGSSEASALLVAESNHVGGAPGGVASLISVNGVVSSRWGLISGQSPGPVEVCFGPVPDLASPPCQTVTLASGVTTNLQGDFTDSPGAPGDVEGKGLLGVRSSPAVPSAIWVNGVRVKEWSIDWVPTIAGDYEICFSDVPEFRTPPCQNVVVADGLITNVTGEFTRLASLRVVTSPPVDVTITVDGVPRNQWGLWTSIEAGTHFVCAQFPTGEVCEPAVSVTAGALTFVTLSP